MQDLIVQGMHGLGDNIHQRGIIKHLMQSRRVWLETPWPAIYWDIAGDRLKLINKGSTLRTQAKNARREAERFTRERPPVWAKKQRIWYPPELVRRHGSVYAAMCAAASVPVTDFSLPIHPAWQIAADDLIERWQPSKPILIYRPLIERSEWSGCPARNPDHEAYAELIESIRERFFVVSVADLQPQAEWLVGKRINADVELHAGELDIETLAALTQRAAMVFSSPGFAVVLAQSIGTPVCCIFGGYENASSFRNGVTKSRYLGIEPIKSCQCFSHHHACDKSIDMEQALQQLETFTERTNADIADSL